MSVCARHHRLGHQSLQQRVVLGYLASLWLCLFLNFCCHIYAPPRAYVHFAVRHSLKEVRYTLDDSTLSTSHIQCMRINQATAIGAHHKLINLFSISVANQTTSSSTESSYAWLIWMVIFFCLRNIRKKWNEKALSSHIHILKGIADNKMECRCIHIKTIQLFRLFGRIWTFVQE